jgi:hypothetical protein
MAVAYTVLTQTERGCPPMNGCPVSFPVRYGTGLQRVSLYAPTIALPYYRITYRTGGKRATFQIENLALNVL